MRAWLALGAMLWWPQTRDWRPLFNGKTLDGDAGKVYRFRNIRIRVLPPS